MNYCTAKIMLGLIVAVLQQESELFGPLDALYEMRQEIGAGEVYLETTIVKDTDAMYNGATIHRVVKFRDGLFREEVRYHWPNGKQSLNCKIMGTDEIVVALQGTPIELTEFNVPAKSKINILDPRLLGLEWGPVGVLANTTMESSLQRFKRNREIPIQIQSVSGEQLEGIECKIVKYRVAGDEVTIAFSPQYDNSVVLFEVRPAIPSVTHSKLLWTATYRQVDEHWFPAEIEYLQHESNTLVRHERTTITRAVFSPPPELGDFKIESLSEEFNGRMGFRNGRIPFKYQNGKLETEGVNLASRISDKKSRYLWLIYAGSAILMVSGLALFLRKNV